MSQMSSSHKGRRYIHDVLDYSRELLEKEDYSNLRIKDIVGFEAPKGASVFLPYIKCVPTVTLLPLYDTLVVGIPKIENINHMKDEIGMTFDDLVTLAHKGKLILYVNVDCPICLEEMSDVIQQLVDNNVHLFFGIVQSTLLALKTAEPLGVDIDRGRQLLKDFHLKTEDKKDRKFRKKLEALATEIARARGFQHPFEEYLSAPHAIVCAMIKPTAEYMQQLAKISRDGQQKEYVQALQRRLYMIPKFLIAKAFNSTFSTNIGCRFIEGIEKKSKETPTEVISMEQFDRYELEFIEKKLHIAYSEDIPLAQYSDLFDSKITDAMRKLVRKIVLEASLKGKSFVTLQNSLDDYNRQVEELISRSARRTKMIYATSDILRSNAGAIKLLMQGIAEKFISAPQRAWDCFVIPKGYRHAISKWLDEKAVKVESKLAGVSPEVIHLYRTRTCLEKLKRGSRA